MHKDEYAKLFKKLKKGAYPDIDEDAVLRAYKVS